MAEFFDVYWETNNAQLTFKQVNKHRVSELKECFEVHREFLGGKNFTIAKYGIVDILTWTGFAKTTPGLKAPDLKKFPRKIASHIDLSDLP